MSFKVAVLFCIPTSNEDCSTPSPAFTILSVLDFGHSNRCLELVSHCFNLQFSNDIQCWEIPSYCMPICDPYIFTSSLMKCLFRSFAHCLSRLSVLLLLSCKISLYVFPFILYQLSFVNIIYQSVAYLLILLNTMFWQT